MMTSINVIVGWGNVSLNRGLNMQEGSRCVDMVPNVLLEGSESDVLTAMSKGLTICEVSLMLQLLCIPKANTI